MKRGGWCSACGRADRAATRRRELAPAYDSLPAWPWARFGDPKLESFARDPKAAEILEAARGWKRSAGNLTLLGPTGIGKTSVVTAIAHRALDMVRDGDDLPELAVELAAAIRFMSAVDLADAARRWPPRDANYPPMVQEALDASVLFLDDLGHEDPKDRSVFKVIESRYRAKGKQTVVTSRLSRADMQREDRYGEDGARRIFELSVVVPSARGGRP